MDECANSIWGHGMHLVDCTEEYWDFVRVLRNDPEVQDGFIEKANISPQQQKEYMKKYSHGYKIAIHKNKLVFRLIPVLLAMTGSEIR